MKNTLVDLQNHLFSLIEKLDDDDLKGDDLDRTLKKSASLNELAKTAIKNGALMAKCADTLYGIPISNEVPLIPKVNEETYIANKKGGLIPVPRKDEGEGYKKGARSMDFK